MGLKSIYNRWRTLSIALELKSSFVKSGKRGVIIDDSAPKVTGNGSWNSVIQPWLVDNAKRFKTLQIWCLDKQIRPHCCAYSERLAENLGR